MSRMASGKYGAFCQPPNRLVAKIAVPPLVPAIILSMINY